ncbi:MAG: winged helix DNA-binding domain-containing protein [Solobacterium sp.]|nr:winged helix DNA-binding domain-containing protein [Solobacterium sp.]
MQKLKYIVYQVNMMQTITKQQARQFILAKQGLIGSYKFTGKEGALAYVRQAGCIQFDPVDVCGKNAELTLQSRVKGFRKTMLQELLYQDRKLVDYVDKELSIWPTEDWPYFSSFRERSLQMSETFEGLQELKETALSYIDEHGPVSSDSLPVEGEIFWHSSMHWSGNWHKKSAAARSVLEQLYTDGTLIIHHKNGSRKYYDIAEKYLPAEMLNAENPCRTDSEYTAWRVLRRIGAVGLLWDKNSPALLGIQVKAEQRKKILADLTEERKICQIMVEDVKTPFYYLSSDEELMQKVKEGSADLKPRMSFIAPLDPLLWDKALITALFDFTYAWEIYTPAEKRKYGYYTLPILYGDRFIGRIEAVPGKDGILRVNGLWWEPGVRQTKKLNTALDRTLQNFAGFNGCRNYEL